MRFDIITLFPDFFSPLLFEGVTSRAFESGRMSVHLHNPRDWAVGNYKRIDDRPFGGGPGMVMLAEPLTLCLKNIRMQRDDQAPVVLFSPIGELINHTVVASWSGTEGAILICGRYEGVDQRFIDQYVTHQLSLGDFVVSGGEIPALALLDAIARLQPGVLNDLQSHLQDSFNPVLDGLLDGPNYTRPEVWQGHTVPDVLLSGHHSDIEVWRREARLALSSKWRPDLIQKARQQGLLSKKDEAFLRECHDKSSNK